MCLAWVLKWADRSALAACLHDLPAARIHALLDLIDLAFQYHEYKVNENTLMLTTNLPSYLPEKANWTKGLTCLLKGLEKTVFATLLIGHPLKSNDRTRCSLTRTTINDWLAQLGHEPTLKAISVHLSKQVVI